MRMRMDSHFVVSGVHKWQCDLCVPATLILISEAEVYGIGYRDDHIH